MKVLVVDDHVIVREGIRRLLAPIPEFVVIEAPTAREAAAAFRSQHPDVRTPRSESSEWERP